MSKKKSPEIFGQNIIRNLGDKLYERRKLGALEIEQMVTNLKAQDQTEKIEEVFLCLNENFIKSSSVNLRKGGLIGLAASSLGLGKDVHLHLHYIIPPILSCFFDSDNKVRYYACESLYNVAKIARGHILAFLDLIFDELCKVIADSDSNVRSAASLLDLLIKDIITEGHRFYVPNFIDYISKRMVVNSPECRKFLVSWILTIDSIPEIKIVQYMHLLLDGLFKILSDSNEEIRNSVSLCLYQFLEQIQEDIDILNLEKVLSISTSYCHVSDMNNTQVNCAALEWIQKIILLTEGQYLSYVNLILDGLLSCISHESSKVMEFAIKINSLLLEQMSRSDSKLNIDDVLNIILKHIDNKDSADALNMAILDWMLCLYEKSPMELVKSSQVISEKLIKLLNNNSESLVNSVLLFFGKISVHELCFKFLIKCLIEMFKSDRKLLESRGGHIIRLVSCHLIPEKFYRAISIALIDEEDYSFNSLMVQTLNFILMTCSESLDLKNSLINLSAEKEELFLCLYKFWCYNPPSLLCLCLLTQVYKHSADLIYKFATMELNVEFFLELDKLIQLLESYAFSFLRLQLLEVKRHPYLFKTLYGLLMLLPQSKSYKKLKKRLETVNPVILDIIPQSEDCSRFSDDSIDFDLLLVYFDRIQEKRSDFFKKSSSISV